MNNQALIFKIKLSNICVWKMVLPFSPHTCVSNKSFENCYKEIKHAASLRSVLSYFYFFFYIIFLLLFHSFFFKFHVWKYIPLVWGKPTLFYRLRIYMNNHANYVYLSQSVRKYYLHNNNIWSLVILYPHYW